MSEILYKGLTVLTFSKVKELHDWFDKNHARTEGFWIRYFKKATGKPTIIHDQAIDEALCFGWIDGLTNKYDEDSWVVRFTPRKAKSVWSKVNVAKVAKLIEEGRMTTSGLVHVVSAKADGRWDAAYAGPATMTLPDEFVELLKTDEVAWDYYQSLNKANKYAVGYRLAVIVDPEKKKQKMQQLYGMLQSRKSFH
ncbi:YdeI/OmpD-associated family protein [Candidatus Woesebacteria bacterium]|nr:YdeI/OmpD-associated family protein [Candidatus Woesebacteria bacterium]